MRGQEAAGDEALTTEEQALVDASAAAPPIAEEAPAPEPAQGDDAAVAGEQPGQAQQQPKTVPHEAMHQERRARQEAEAALAAERKRGQTLEERMNLLLQRQFAQPAPEPPQGQKPAATELPDINQDPVGHLVGQIGQIRNDLGQRDQIIAALAQAVTGQGRQSEATQAANAVATRATALEREFAAQTPDYTAAYEFLLENRANELRENGWTDLGEIQLKLAQEAQELAQQSIRRGVNPAETAYKLSKIRGYKSPSAPPPANNAAAEQVAAIAAGQQQARGINRVPGQASARPDAATIANMSDEEFNAWAAKATDKERRQVGL